jgi:hypothetical protein
MSWVQRTMIVTAAQAPLARALTAGLAGASGTNMFATPLSATGALPATHYISTGLIQDSFAALLEDADAVYAAAQQAGAPVTLAQINALLTASDLSEDEPFAAMARLGVKMIPEAL